MPTVTSGPTTPTPHTPRALPGPRACPRPRKPVMERISFLWNAETRPEAEK